MIKFSLVRKAVLNTVKDNDARILLARALKNMATAKSMKDAVEVLGAEAGKKYVEKKNVQFAAYSALTILSAYLGNINVSDAGQNLASLLKKITEEYKSLNG